MSDPSNHRLAAITRSRCQGSENSADPAGATPAPTRSRGRHAAPADAAGNDGDTHRDDIHPLGSGAQERVAAAYGAAYGHPTTHSGFDDPGRSRAARFGLSPRTATVAAIAVLVSILAVVGWLRFDAARAGEMVGPRSVATGDPQGVATGEESAPPSTPQPAAQVPEVAPDQHATPTTAASVVHVVGQVNHPGVVSLPTGARVTDAITAAGGATTTADLGRVNLARPVVDGEQIIVPAPGEAIDTAPPASGQPQGSAAAAVPPAAGTSTTSGVIDLNTADVVALDGLPGIGPVLAERIVAWRTQNGRFTSVDELTEIDGIGPSVLAKLSDRVRV